MAGVVAIQAFCFLLFGLVVGSFLTVVVYRVPRHESVVSPRSRCPGCGSPVAARDNVPILSWVLLRGRCRRCGEPISARYPLTEVVNGALWVVASLRFADELFPALVFSLFFSLLLAVSLIDLEHRIIPNAITYPAVPVFAALLAVGAALGNGFDLLDAFFGALAYGGGLLLVALLYPKGMGMGDVKLAVIIGLVLGAIGPLHYVLPAALFAFFLGALGGILAMAVGKKGRKSAVPFGPFMASGAVLSVFLGPPVMDWYLNILGG